MPTPNPSKINSCLFVIIQCTAIAAMIVGIANLFFKDFFFIDDAQNQNLPFYREIGRIWLSGHLPILTTNTFLGGNLLLDMVTSPFAPQTILTSLLSTQIESFRVVANFLAWMNISLVMLGAYWLGRVYAIRPGYCLLLSFSVATNPIFLYVFAANWWNLASAFAWFMISFAAIMHFRAKPTIKLYCVGVGSVCALFASAGTHIQIAFLLFTAIIVIRSYALTTA